jgi:hypothetical protein
MHPKEEAPIKQATRRKRASKRASIFLDRVMIPFFLLRQRLRKPAFQMTLQDIDKDKE